MRATLRNPSRGTCSNASITPVDELGTYTSPSAPFTSPFGYRSPVATFQHARVRHIVTSPVPRRGLSSYF